MYDQFGFPEEFTEIIAPDDFSVPVVDETADEPHVLMRENFPAAGEKYLGGESDGWEYRTFFAGANLGKVFEMVKMFLAEEGFGDVPLPETAADLRLFKRPRPGQLQLFGEAGYFHNPIKIIFPSAKDKRRGLILCIYNEKMPGHLLRFHGF